jgi:hypothetical protein
MRCTSVFFLLSRLEPPCDRGALDVFSLHEVHMTPTAPVALPDVEVFVHAFCTSPSHRTRFYNAMVHFATTNVNAKNLVKRKMQQRPHELLEKKTSAHIS